MQAAVDLQIHETTNILRFHLEVPCTGPAYRASERIQVKLVSDFQKILQVWLKYLEEKF